MLQGSGKNVNMIHYQLRFYCKNKKLYVHKKERCALQRLVYKLCWDCVCALISIQPDVRAKVWADLIKMNAWAKLIRNSNGGTERLINLLINSRYSVSSFVSRFD